MAISVEDHYVQVRSLRGEEMLLMRHGDATRKTAPKPGHEVAPGQVRAARRTGDRAVPTVAPGSNVPARRATGSAARNSGPSPR